MGFLPFESIWKLFINKFGLNGMNHKKPKGNKSWALEKKVGYKGDVGPGPNIIFYLF
jgi:hypothetical protein